MTAKCTFTKHKKKLKIVPEFKDISYKDKIRWPHQSTKFPFFPPAFYY